MKRIEAYAVAILLALVPAVFGLWGNTSFSKVVPVLVPDQARATVAVAGVDMRQVQTAYRAGLTPAERGNGRHGADDPVTHDAGDDQVGDRTGPRSGDLGSGEGERDGDRVDTSGSSGSGHGSGGNSGHRSGGGDDSGVDSTGSGKAESGDIRVDTSGSSGSGHGSDD